MNERILEIADTAKIEVEKTTNHKISVNPQLYMFVEKFAELIVEEMYDFIMDESAKDNGIPDLGKVKEHFGVEE